MGTTAIVSTSIKRLRVIELLYCRRALKKAVEVITYHDQGHCFCYYAGSAMITAAVFGGAPHPPVALKASAIERPFPATCDD
jgi:hypothetical protein